MANARMSDKNDFYRTHFTTLIVVLIAAIFLLVLLVIFLLYQIQNRPHPPFYAMTPKREQMILTASEEPNLMPNAVINWASKAAVDLYTYNFAESDAEVQTKIEPYFTESGAKAFYISIQNLLNTIRQNKLITNCAVNGQPVISNQGDLPRLGTSWRIQIPFLVTYQSAENSSTTTPRVTVVITKVPTTQNPVGFAIDQFSM